MKIFFYLIGFCAFLLVVLWFMQVVFLDSFYKRTKLNESSRAMSMLERNMNKEDFFEIAKETSANYDVLVQISMATVLYSNVAKITKIYSIGSEKYTNDIVFNNTRQMGNYYAQAKINNGEYIEEFTNNINHTKIIETEGGYDLIINLTTTIIPVNATVNTLRTQLSFVTIIMILVSFLLAFYISKYISTPIISINEKAKILATGKYDIEFNGEGYQEIEELSRTLNYTAKELSKVEELRKELIANISHDLRTPLTLISGYAEAMRDLPGENNKENAQVIIDEAKRLTSLVTDVLDLSKLQTGNETLLFLEFNLTETIESVIYRFSELVMDEGYDIAFNYGKEIHIVADVNRISQVFYNIMINAINYTGEDKKIIVNQIEEEDYIKIEVIDTGMGIKEEDTSKIWERYYTSAEYHKRGVTGTGLGLSIVKEVINVHDGKYGVESKFSEGSKFWFKLKKDTKEKDTREDDKKDDSK